MRPPTKAFTIFYLFLGTICYLFIASVTTASAWNVWLDHSVKKIKQNGFDAFNNPVHSGSQAITLKMARNEFESFQIFIYADGESLSNVDVSISPPTMGDNTITDVHLYKEWYTNCDTASRVEYTTGYYPTALLPKVDRYYGETRNTFPFNVATDQVQGIWVDIGTELNTTPGNYSAQVTVSATGRPPIELTLNIEVWDFVLPSTATFGSMFAIQDGELSNAHMGTPWNASVNDVLYPLYAKMALYHRISTRAIAGAMGIGYDWDSGSKQLTNMNPGHWQNYYTEVLNGTAISSGPYAGAKAISSVVPRWGSMCITDSDPSIANADKPTAAIQYLQAWYDYFGTNGWDPANNLFVMVEDEPKTYTNVNWRGQTISEVDKALTQASEANLIDTSIYGDGTTFKHVIMNAHNESYFDSFIGLFNPWVGHYAPVDWDKNNPDSPYIFPRADYPLADHYWTYFSCMSNECTSTGNDWYSGQMDLSADASAFWNRVMSFYFRKQGNTDFWYFQLNLIYAQDPYYDLWPASGMEGSNGDGQLVYPGVAGEFGGSPAGVHTPNIGGTHDIPIAGIRLRLIRDAMEDMEYFKLAEEQAGKEKVDSIVDSMFTNTDIAMSYWNWNMNPDDLFSARENIAGLITGGSPISVTGDIDQDGDIDLTDAILGLQIATGGTPETISPDGDVDGDGKIGIEEVIYILQSVQE